MVQVTNINKSDTIEKNNHDSNLRLYLI